MQYYLFAISTRLTYLFPSWTSPVMWILNTFGFSNTTTVDVGHKIFNHHFSLPIHAESEIYVHYNDTAPAIRAIQEAVRTQRIPVNYITEVMKSAKVQTLGVYSLAGPRLPRGYVSMGLCLFTMCSRGDEEFCGCGSLS